MPQRILQDTLKLLRRLYGPGGQLQAPLDIEYALPIQVVHDVSREAELGEVHFPGQRDVNAGRSSYFTINADQVHVAAGTIQTLLGVYSNQPTTWALATWNPPDPEVETVWILDVFLVSLTRSIAVSFANNDIHPKAGAGAGLAARGAIWVGDIAAAAAEDTAGFSPIAAVDRSTFPVQVSNKLLNNTPIELVTSAAAADTGDWLIRCMRLPVGVQPPGLQ